MPPISGPNYEESLSSGPNYKPSAKHKQPSPTRRPAHSQQDQDQATPVGPSGHGSNNKEYIIVLTALDPTRHTAVASASGVLKNKPAARQHGTKGRNDPRVTDADERTQTIQMEAA